MHSLRKTPVIDGAFEGPAILIAPLSGLDRTMVRCPRASAPALSALAAEACGMALPLIPNTVEKSEGAVRALWLERGAWLVTAPEHDLAPRLAPLSADLRAVVLIVDMSSGYSGLRLSGAKARAVLEAGCPLDLYSSAFGPDRCASSAYDQIPLIVEQLDDEPTYHLFCDRSRAPALWDALVQAADLLF